MDNLTSAVDDTKEFVAHQVGEGETWDVAIIGSGPAAFAAAIYTTRGARSTVIIGGENWGGQLMLTSVVDNFPGFPEGIMGPDLMMNMKKQAERFGAKFINKNALSIETDRTPFEVKTDKESIKAKTIIVATGAETVWLTIPGEYELLGKGISSCAPCDAPFYKNKKVAVVGGGDSAMEEALILTKYATEVTIIHRRNEFKASKVMQDKVLNNEKIKILWDTNVKEAQGKEKLEKLLLVNNKTNETSELIVDGMFVAIGHSPLSSIFQGKLDIDEKGFIKKYEKDGYHSRTNKDGIFVAGDVHDYHYKQAITAAAFGCMAALDTIHYLDNQEK